MFRTQRRVVCRVFYILYRYVARSSIQAGSVWLLMHA